MHVIIMIVMLSRAFVINAKMYGLTILMDVQIKSIIFECCFI